MKMKVSLSVIRYFFAIIILFFCCYLLLSSNLGTEYNTFIGWLCIFSIIMNGVTLKKQNNTWFSLTFMFELSYCILTMGQAILTALGAEIGFINQYTRENVADVNKAYIFNLMCYLALHFGIVYKLTITPKHIMENEEEYDFKPIMQKVGWIIFVISIIPFSIEFYRLIIAYSALGYRAAYVSISGATSWNKAISYVADLFPTCIFMLLVSYKNNRQMKYLLSILVLVLSLINFAIGNRNEPVCYIVALLWVYRRYSVSESSKRKTTLIAIIGGVLLVLIIPIIGQTRNTGELSIKTIVQGVIGEGSIISTFVASIASLGYSVFPTIKTMQLIPDIYPFHYGQSYFFALLSIIPNFFGGTHISVKYAALAQWLMHALNMGTGPGFSMPAEAYYNFGWFGILIMPILGYIIGTLLDERDIENKPFHTFIKIACFIVLFSIPRRDTLTAFRNLAYNVGLIVLIVKFFARHKYKSI